MKIKKIQEILFYPVNEQAALYIDPPLPSSNFIPEWYKKIPKYKDRSNKFRNYGIGDNNLSVKSCLPIVDSLTSGYMISLPHDIQISRDNSNLAPIINWSFSVNGLPDFINSRPNRDDSCAWDNIDGYDDLLFNWLPFWCIKTPKGYSSLFSHPVNRPDLPFYTLGGILDTDGFGDAGNHPFLIKSGWEGIIPAGTPIIQIIPFKRENWRSKADKTMIKEFYKNYINKNRVLKDYYKNNFWNNKSYK
jgi:hypothetical protein